jgi:6-phosphogluconolactonase
MPQLSDAARRYTGTLRAVCGTPPVLDVVHLGLGPDGHTASLFPGDPLLDEEDPDDPESPAVAPAPERAGWERLTLTLPVLNRARHRVWLVTGADKAEALAALLAGGDVPGARVAADGAVLFADRAAAGTVT